VVPVRLDKETTEEARQVVVLQLMAAAAAAEPVLLVRSERQQPVEMVELAHRLIHLGCRLLVKE
jgi:hypothetical protein